MADRGTLDHKLSARYVLFALCSNISLAVLLIQVISAQQLPKPQWDKPSSIVDPHVWVEVYGVPIDNNKKKTHHVDNNGTYFSHWQKHLLAVSYDHE